MLEKLKLFFNTCSDAVICERDGTIIYMNDAAARICRRDLTGESIGQIFDARLLGSTADVFSFTAGLGEKTGVCVTACRVDDFRVITALLSDDGQVQLARLYSHLGETLKSSVSVYQMAEGLLRPYIENMGNGQLSSYAAMISHSGYSILRSASNIARLGDVDNDEPVEYTTTLDLLTLCRDVYASVSHFTGRGCAELRFETSLREAPVRGDAAQLEEALLNVFSNSFKYTPKNGVVMFTLSALGDSYIISVTDTGSGIPEKIMRSVFTRYCEPRDIADARCGVGVGLALVRHIARRHGGNAMIESRVGIGTKTSLMLPAAERPDRLSFDAEDYGGGGVHLILTELSDVLTPDCYTPLYLD